MGSAQACYAAGALGGAAVGSVAGALTQYACEGSRLACIWEDTGLRCECEGPGRAHEGMVIGALSGYTTGTFVAAAVVNAKAQNEKHYTDLP